MLKALFVLEIFKFFSWLFGYAKKWLDKTTKVNFKIYDVTNWTTINYNTYIVQSLWYKSNQTMKFGQLTGYNMRNIFFTQNVVEKLVLDPFIKNQNWAYL